MTRSSVVTVVRPYFFVGSASQPSGAATSRPDSATTRSAPQRRRADAATRRSRRAGRRTRCRHRSARRPPARRTVTTRRDHGEAQCVEIGVERAQRGAVTFDEHAVLGAARQGLDAEGAAAGEQIGDERPLEQPGAAERVEDRLPHAVGGGTGRTCRRGAISSRPPSSPATTRITPGYEPGRFERCCLRSLADCTHDPTAPQIVCIDCGGRCFLLTPSARGRHLGPGRHRRLPLRGLPRPLGPRDSPRTTTKSAAATIPY